MKKIFVRKILEYDPTFSGKYSRYEGYKGSTLQKLDPSIVLPREKITLVDTFQPTLFCSSLLRGKQTAHEFASGIQHANVICLSDLNEVLFDLEILLDEKEFEAQGSVLVRKRFIESFISDSLLESREIIHTRIKRFLDELENFPEGNYLVISHSFFMKIFQVYLHNKSLFEKPEILSDSFDYHQKTFKYGEGFEFVL